MILCKNGTMELYLINGLEKTDARFMRMSDGQLIEAMGCMWNFDKEKQIYHVRWNAGNYLGHISDNLK